MTDTNTGEGNSGNRNSGDRNGGSRNSGYRNSGNCNSGNCNSGDWNSGYWNSGYCNSGNRNSGGYNSGDWNSGHRHAGCFNTTECEGGYFFNKWLASEEWNSAYKPHWLYDIYPATWVEAVDMSDQEKVDNPTFSTCGGYLRVNDMAEEWRKAFEGASEEDIQAVRDLPNFDYDVFEEITGLDLRVNKVQPLTEKTVYIDGKKYRLQEVTE